jgi:uncharacterized protein
MVRRIEIDAAPPLPCATAARRIGGGSTPRPSEAIAAQPTDSGLAPERGARRGPAECGDLPFLIRRDGSWLYKNSPIGRKELVCLFASVLRREADGSFWLETPVERGKIEVEDAPFVVVEMDWSGNGLDQVLTFRTNVDEVVSAGLEHPLRLSHGLGIGEPKPYLRIRPGAGSHPIEARINRSVYYELAALAEPHPVRGRMMLGVWSEGVFFPLSEMPAGDE